MYDDEELTDVKKGPAYYFKKFLKHLIASLIAALYLIIFIRIFVSCDSSINKRVITDITTLKAYNADTVNFEVRQYAIHDYYRNISNGKMLRLDQQYYIPSSKQLQFTVKYNLDLADAPADDKIPFTFYLIDEKGNRYEDYFFKTDTKRKFGYIRVCFNDIVLEDTEAEKSGEEEQKMKNYELYIEKTAEDKQVPFENFSLYNGSTQYKLIKFKPGVRG